MVWLMHKSSWNRCYRKVKTGYDRAGSINAVALSYGNAPLYAPCYKPTLICEEALLW